jgi:CheY-like chemotaxis protein
MLKQTIMVVEDNPANLLLARSVLSRDGYDVMTAPDAREARARLAEDLPDLILMDISLPDIDGLTLTRYLKTQRATAHIPIVALTAHAMDDDERKALEAGCDGYITKPIDTRTLALKVHSFLVAPRRSAVAGGTL